MNQIKGEVLRKNGKVNQLLTIRQSHRDPHQVIVHHLSQDQVEVHLPHQDQVAAHLHRSQGLLPQIDHLPVNHPVHLPHHGPERKNSLCFFQKRPF